MMGWTWTEDDARRYQSILAAMRVVDPVVAPLLRGGIFRLNIVDLRVRRRLGIPRVLTHKEARR